MGWPEGLGFRVYEDFEGWEGGTQGHQRPQNLVLMSQCTGLMPGSC